MNPVAFANKAARKFAQYGQPMVLYKVEQITADPITGQAGIQICAMMPFSGLWDDDSKQVHTKAANVPVVGVQAQKTAIWASGSEVKDPAVNDIVVCEGKGYAIEAVEAIKPGAVPICYKLLVREDGSFLG